MNALAPDGRTWLEWAAEYHATDAVVLRRLNENPNLSHALKESLDELAEQHEAMATACREAHEN